MQLQPGAFNRLLGNMGQRVLWRPSTLCPCRSPFSGAAEQGCPVCSGRGVFWQRGQESVVGVTSMQVARQWAAFGQWQSGDVVLSVPEASPAYAAAESDQFIMLNSETPYSSTFTRGAEDERLPAYMVRLNRVVTIEDERPMTKALPILPPVATGGAPIWPASGGPAVGQQYSISGVRRPIYFLLTQLPQDRAHHGGLRLPRRIAARLFDLFGR